MSKILSKTIIPTKVPQDSTECANDAGFPQLKADDFRIDFKIDETVTSDFLCNALTNSAYAINKDLLNKNIDFDSAKNKNLYSQAVGARAKALIVETYRDIDTKNAADAEKLELPAEFWKQQSRESIRLLLNKPRATVELI